MLTRCAFLGTILALRVAAADPESTDAKTAYAEGSRHYDLREFREAIEAFRRAYSLDPKPLVLFDIAQSYRQLRECEDARGFYQTYLRNAPEADNRAKVETFIAEMDSCIAEKAKASPPATKQPPAPAHVPAPAPTASHSQGLRNLGITTALLGLAATGAAVYFSLDAQQRANDVEQTCNGGCDAADVIDADRAGRASSRDALILYIAGGALVTAGAVMLGLAVTRDEIVLTPTPGGAVVGGQVRF